MGYSLPKRLFVDMDGTLAEFKPVEKLETLYEQGYFRNLKPNKNVIDAVNEIIHNHPEIDVYIMSAVLTDSKYALTEKKEWLSVHLPDMPLEKCIFPPCGCDKREYVFGGIRSDDYLLDDYSINLNAWEPPARGIKLLNGINGNSGMWSKTSLRYDKFGLQLANDLCRVVNDNEKIIDSRPQDTQEMLLSNQWLFSDVSEKSNEISNWTDSAIELSEVKKNHHNKNTDDIER